MQSEHAVREYYALVQRLVDLYQHKQYQGGQVEQHQAFLKAVSYQAAAAWLGWILEEGVLPVDNPDLPDARAVGKPPPDTP